MYDDDQKLRVPGPDESPHEEDEHGDSLVVAAALSLVLGLSFFLYQYELSQTPTSDHTDAPTTNAQDDESSELERRAERLEVLYGGDKLADYRWGPRDIRAAYRFGPRGVAEMGCRRTFGERAGELRTDEVSRELLSALDRRVAHAPWSCLFRAFFSDNRQLDDGIASELGDLWETIRAFDGPGRTVATVVRDFAADGFFPDDPTFRRWARLCALNFETHEGGACRELLGSVAPSQGSDLLEVVEVHLRETDLNPTYDLPILIAGLGHLAAEGQPPGWRIVETDALPDYDTDLRLGAIFYLCRFVNSPDTPIAERASKALSRAADYGVRAGDRTRRPRWLAACRHAFGTTEDGAWAAPALAVWTGDRADPPRYALTHAVDRGDCEVRDGHPRWYCGSAKFNGSTPGELTDFYVETSGMEWEDESPLELD